MELQTLWDLDELQVLLDIGDLIDLWEKFSYELLLENNGDRRRLDKRIDKLHFKMTLLKIEVCKLIDYNRELRRK